MTMAQQQHQLVKDALNTILSRDMPRLEKALQDAGAPWIEGQALPED